MDFESLASRKWTVDDLGGLAPGLRYELISGHLRLLPDSLVHRDLCVRIAWALNVGCPTGLLAVHSLSLAVDRWHEFRPAAVTIGPDHVHQSPVPAADAKIVVEVVPGPGGFGDMYAKAQAYAGAGVMHWWVIESHFPDGIELTEFRLGSNGRYEAVGSTSEVFITDVPYPITIDLPALTQRRGAMLDRARSRE